jgi:hypothetical protein
MYRLPKDLTLTLISGYSVPMRHKIVTRWQELEAPLPRLFGALDSLPFTLKHGLRNSVKLFLSSF